MAWNTFDIGASERAMKNIVSILRAQHKWSQAEVADMLGVSRQTINAIETGRYDPSLPLAFKIGSLFDVPIEEVFTPDTDTTKPDQLTANNK